MSYQFRHSAGRQPFKVTCYTVICKQSTAIASIIVYPLSQIPRCAPCPAGYSCGNITQPPVPCPSGFYSLQGDASCTECEAGQACTDPAQAPKHCTSGTYSLKVCTWLHATQLAYSFV